VNSEGTENRNRSSAVNVKIYSKQYLRRRYLFVNRRFKEHKAEFKKPEEGTILEEGEKTCKSLSGTEFWQIIRN
jgi:hypothetical protein